MSNDVVIDSQKLGKCYRLGERRGRSYKTLRESITDLAAAPLRKFRSANKSGSAMTARPSKKKNGRVKAHAEEPELWALRDADFQVRRGEVLGIIGHNGAGKSTLLKILSRITEPTTGQVSMNGRVSSLLEVGTGFHPELTGRENVFMNGSILGMTRVEIKRKFDEIVAFSGVEKFLDTPVKRYSSGMSVRLAFAVAAHLEPEILVIDEVLAVGDFEFQNRCLGKMNEVARSGRTILFVSHNMAAVENLCTRAILFDRGQIKKDGAVHEVISLYHNRGGGTGRHSTDFQNHPGRREGMKPVVTSLRMLDADGLPTESVPLGGDCTFELTMESGAAPLQGVAIVMRLLTSYGERVCTFHTKHQHAGSLAVDGKTIALCAFKNCRLYPGEYSLAIQVKSYRTVVDEIDDALKLTVTQRDAYGTGRAVVRRGGCYLPETEWRFAE